MTTLLIILALAAGFALGWYISGLRTAGRAQGDLASVTASLAETRSQSAADKSELSVLRQALELEKITAAESRARLESARDHFAEQRRQIADMQDKVRDAFKALSADALKNSGEQFITLADANLKPLREQLQRYEAQITELEKARAGAYGGLSEKLKTLEASEQRLTQETSQLVAALRQPGAKGRWGEVTLQRIVELAGMTPHCDFMTQATQDGGQRPDLIVKLPNNRTLVIDAKVNASAYLDAMAATTDEDRKRHLDRYRVAIRTALKGLAAKEYWKQFSPAPEFVVMFMPGEAFFSAAVAQDPDLIIDGVDSAVVVASPTTLIALLMTVRHGWQQVAVAENAQHIAEAGRDLYDRLCTFADHLDDVRGGLAKAADAYNKAVGNWASRTLPGAKKLKDLGATDAGKALPILGNIDIPLRAVPREEDSDGNERRRAV